MSTQDHAHHSAPVASLSDIECLQTLAAGYTVTASIVAAAELKIADCLAEGPLLAQEIATRCGALAEPVYRLLRALASVDVVREVEAGRFALTPVGAALRSDSPCSLVGIMKMISSDWYWRSWGALPWTIRTGEPSFTQLFGTDFFSYIKERPAEAAGFHAGMTSLSSISDHMVANAYDFQQHVHVVDVGGGSGGLLAAVLEAAPALRGTLYDLPHAIETALPQLTSGLLSERCSCVAGDFLAHVPEGGDAYILKHVLHGLGPEMGATVLRRIREAMAPDGRLIVVDMVIPAGNEPGYAKFNDLGMMLLSNGGRERTQGEFETLFAVAGFALSRLTPIAMGLSIIIAAAA